MLLDEKDTEVIKKIIQEASEAQRNVKRGRKRWCE